MNHQSSQRWYHVAVCFLFALSVIMVPAAAQPVPSDLIEGAESAGVVCGDLIETTWAANDWAIVTSNNILRQSLCVQFWYDRIDANNCWSMTKYWKIAPGTTFASAVPMASLAAPSWTFDGLYVRSGYSVRLYHPGFVAFYPQGVEVTGPRFVSLIFWQNVSPAPFGFEPNTLLLPGGEGGLSGWSLTIGHLGIVSVSDLETLNEAAQYTAQYAKPDTLVLRRGDIFKADVRFQGELDEFCAQLGFIAEHNFDGTPTQVPIPLYWDTVIPAGKWGTRIESVQANGDGTKTAKMQIQIPGDAPIGSYTMSATTWPPDPGVPGSIVAFPRPIVVLFNPWSNQDEVFMADDAQRKEYVLETTGVMWKWEELAASTTTVAWRYAQFDTESLDIFLLAIDGMPAAERTSPVLVSRFCLTDPAL